MYWLIYFLPTIFALVRGKRGLLLFICNMLLGSVGFFWFIMLLIGLLKDE